MNSIPLNSLPILPQRKSSGWTSFGMALVMHALLIGFLYNSVQWQSAEPEGMDAELFSDLPSIAAPPMPVEPKPVPKIEPKVEPKPEPKPEPKIEPKPEVKPDIVLEQEKKRKELEAIKLAELQDKKKKEEDLKKQQAEDKLKAQEAAKLAAKEAAKDAAKREAEHQKMVQSMLGQVGGTAEKTTGGKVGQGTGSSTVSSGYAGRVDAYIKRYIVFNDETDENPSAVVEMTLSPVDGTIMSRKIKTSSGNKTYNDAVLRALDKAERLPSDNGKYHTPLELNFRLRNPS